MIERAALRGAQTVRFAHRTLALDLREIDGSGRATARYISGYLLY